MLHGHLWGARFQMPVIGERQLPAGMAGIFQAEKAGYPLNMKVFWPSDKFRIRADITSALPCVKRPACVLFSVLPSMAFVWRTL
jgi:hypothetical protein